MGVGHPVDPVSGLRASVLEQLDSWGLAEPLHEASKAAATWACYCSPDDASEPQRRLAALDLTLWLFAVDDHEGPDVDAYLQRCRAQLRGEGSSDDALGRARDELTRTLLDAAGPAGLRRYFESRIAYVDAIGRRNRVRDGRDPLPSYDDYLRLRETTIYVDQWIEVWSIVAGFERPQAGVDDPRWMAAERAIAHCHILQNEPRSLERDRASRTPNLVDLLCAQQDCGIDEGIAAMAHQHQRACADYDEAIGPLRGDPRAPAPYVQLLDACRFGGRRATDGVESRYQPEPSPTS